MMSRFRHLPPCVLLCGCIVGVAGCVTAPTTTTGALDFVVPTANRKCLVDDLANKFADKGFVLVSQNENSIVAQKQTQNIAAGLLLASEAYTQVDERITANSSK